MPKYYMIYFENCHICKKPAKGWSGFCSKEHGLIQKYMYVGETLKEYNIRKKLWIKRKKELKSHRSK